MLIKLLFLASVAAATSTPQVLNNVMDTFLNGFKQMIRDQGSGTVKIDSFHQTWHYGGMFDLNGETNCYNGWVKSFTSIKRTGDVLTSSSGDASYYQLELGLSDLEFSFESCSVTHFITISQPVSARIDDNSIKWVISLRGKGSSCIASTEFLEISKLDGFHIKTGEGVLHETEDRIVEWLASAFKKTLIYNINRRLNALAKDHIIEFDLCKTIPVLLQSNIDA